MLATVSSRELSEWQAYERVTGPLGPQRGDHQVAMLAAVLANTARDPKKRSQPFTGRDFLLWADADREEQSMEEQMAMFRAMAAASARAERKAKP